MSKRETQWILETLSLWLVSPVATGSCPENLDPGRVGDILQRNRLLSLFQTLPVAYPETPAWEAFRTRMGIAYQHSLLQGLRQLKTGTALTECLKAAGVASLPVRGPFLARDVFGDVAVRQSADIDILVSCRDRLKAWKACKEAGFISLDWECPLWPFDKHRIHWRLRHKDDSVVCELHWAVEPVYGAMTLNYEAIVREPDASRELLLLCLHAGEHIAESGATNTEEAARQGLLFRWLDVAMFVRKHAGQIDWGRLGHCLRDRRIAACMALCLKGVRDWFAFKLPGGAEELFRKAEDSERIQRSGGFRLWLEKRWGCRLGRAMGVETTLSDVLYYVSPMAPFFAPSRGVPLMVTRVGHSLGSGAVLARELLSYSCFAMITSIRRIGRAGLAAAAIAVSVLTASASEFSDDYGHSPATAIPLAAVTNVSGNIAVDVVQNWYSFQANNSLKEYVVTVTTGTLWNSTAGIVAPDGGVMLAATDSVASVTSRVSWIHIGPPATYFVRVGGFASFTTGSYVLAVSEQSYRDEDGDGMPDAWEQLWWGSTNQLPGTDFDHDGVSNGAEFLAGTDPTHAGSCLRVSAFAATNSQPEVAWSAVAYRVYAVEACTNLAEGGWSRLGTVTNLSALGTLQYRDLSGPPVQVRFYRVRCL